MQTQSQTVKDRIREEFTKLPIDMKYTSIYKFKPLFEELLVQYRVWEKEVANSGDPDLKILWENLVLIIQDMESIYKSLQIQKDAALPFAHKYLNVLKSHQDVRPQKIVNLI